MYLCLKEPKIRIADILVDKKQVPILQANGRQKGKKTLKTLTNKVDLSGTVVVGRKSLR